MKPVKFKSQWGNEYDVIFVKSSYRNNNRIYIGCYCEDKECGGYEPYCDVTVNIASDMPEGNYGYLDTNNADRNLIGLMFENKWIENTGRVGFSGYCTYPLVKFTDEFLNMIETE